MYLTLEQNLYHMKSTKLAIDEYRWHTDEYVWHFGVSVQIEGFKKRIKVWGVKENFRKRNLGKEWNYLEDITKKEISGEVNQVTAERMLRRWLPAASWALRGGESTPAAQPPLLLTWERDQLKPPQTGRRVGVQYKWGGEVGDKQHTTEDIQAFCENQKH